MARHTHRSTAPAGIATIATGVLASLAVAAIGVVIALGWKGSHTVVTSAPAPLPANSPTKQTNASPVASAHACATDPQPDELTLPAVCIHGPIRPTYISSDQLLVPADVKSIFMWNEGAGLTSTRGTTLLVAHVHYGSLGDGPFYPLSQARIGEAINLRDAGGTLTHWRIVSAHAYLKADLPQDVFAGPTGPRRLVLVTCGGDVLPSGSGYADNVVVTAVPA